MIFIAHLEIETRRTRRAKPRIVKPVIKKKDVLAKASGSASKFSLCDCSYSFHLLHNESE